MINEISAEMLLEHLYPDLEQKWTVRYMGTFYRNYNSDILKIYENEPSVELSRDGFLSLLPPSLISKENELDDVDEYGHRYQLDKTTRMKRIRQRLHILTEAFLPFDTFNFRRRLAMERKISELLNLKLAYVLKEYFDIDYESIQNEYVRQAAVLLPYVSKLRGDMNAIKALLHELTGCPVRMRKSSFSCTDNTRVWMPKIHYYVMIEGLTHDEYLSRSAELKPLADFLTEYFIPFDCFSEISIKWERTKGDPLLNYNAYV